MKEILEIDPLSDDGSIARLAAFVQETARAMLDAGIVAALVPTPAPLTDSHPDFREARAAMARGRLCRECGVGYMLRGGPGLWYCATLLCHGLRARRFSAYIPNPDDMLQVWARQGVRHFRRVAVDLSRVVLTPAPASDVVWVWLEVET